jgi:hypothetical protein
MNDDRLTEKLAALILGSSHNAALATATGPVSCSIGANRIAVPIVQTWVVGSARVHRPPLLHHACIGLD